MKKLIVVIVASLVCGCLNVKDTAPEKNSQDSLYEVTLKDDDYLGAIEAGYYCVVEYAVTKEGVAEDVEAVDCPNDKFVGPSIRAARKFRYRPKIVDGVPVRVEGVKNRFVFSPAGSAGSE